MNRATNWLRTVGTRRARSMTRALSRKPMRRGVRSSGSGRPTRRMTASVVRVANAPTRRAKSSERRTQMPTSEPRATGRAMRTATRYPQEGMTPVRVRSRVATAGRISLLAWVARPLSESPSAAVSAESPQLRYSR